MSFASDQRPPSAAADLQSSADPSARRRETYLWAAVLAVVFLIAYVVAFALGLGPVPWMLGAGMLTYKYFLISGVKLRCSLNASNA